MMSAQASFIPLYFGEEEADLWQALQSIEPEKRSSFIKETLRQALLGTAYQKTLDQNPRPYAETPLEEGSTNLKADPPEDDLDSDTKENYQETDSFSLEALFSEVPVLNQNAASYSPPKGYEYMMKHIIGTEEDEEVLKFLQGSSELTSDE